MSPRLTRAGPLFSLARPAFVRGGADALGIDAAGQAQKVVGQFGHRSIGPGPGASSLEELQAILDDRERPYYEHRLAA